ncbi:MAG TPA: cation:proton antiporter [Bacilli bacterium]|jgi:Kef-type K+ transport system membrane component KefB|nr:cation:proton antiporter [Bacilli bacterium]HOH61487.1 cation:proton antiporter [Bacilli bacterium]HPM14385.1 cation:proton antiporter [Bacilli bacterium]HQB95136.1 cation:proton antiporter [Bacilli bacterium]HQO00124.1 cation:proton antiporter [Bacilli bacterium]
MNSLLILAIALFAGLLSTKLMKLVKLPNVTGYLIVGLLLGPHLINIIGEKEIASFSFLIEIALGFIAFSIGGEFKIENLKKIGKNVFLITFVQAFLALVFVDISLIVFGLIQGTLQENLPLILVLGAVATATAPAATLMVIRQYKARGKLTDTLLLVVALDDAFGLVLFAISLAIAKVFAIGGVITFTSIALMPLLEIVVSLGIGTVLGLILSLATRFFRSRANRLIWMITVVFTGVGLAQIFPIPVSSLLLCMMLGAVFCNTKNDSLMILGDMERWTPPLFMLFFIISSAELDLTVIPIVGAVGVIYLIARSAGKYFGAYLGSVIVKEDKSIRNYLGLALLPQAGVAIGMAKISSEALPKYSAQILAVVLCATLFYELVGPGITKFALKKAGDIQSETPVEKLNDET